MVDLSTLPNPTMRAFARELAALRTDVDTVQRGLRATQLQNASIESGTLVVRDGDGNVRQTIGMQPDGSAATVAMNAPTPPPIPNTPELSPIAAGVMVSWNGEFTTGARPADFSHIQIHTGGTDSFIWGPSTLVGTMSDAGQFPLAPLPSGSPVYVLFVAVNTSGLESEPSMVASATPTQVVAQAVLDGIVNTTALADQAVQRAKIAVAAVGTDQIAGQAVTLSQLADGSVDASKLIDGAVTGPKLVDAIVTPAKLGPEAVTGPAIAASAVTAGKIAASTVTAEQMAANTITAMQVAADTLTANEIAASAITTSELNAGSVTSAKVVAGAIGANELAANAVTAGKLAADSVTSTNIVAGTILAGDLAADSVSAGKIAANAITTRELASLSVTADQIAANAVTAGAIQAGAITAAKLAATLVLATRVIAGTLTGTRAEMNSGGFESWKGTTQTFDVNASTGDVMMLGAYKTAQAGTRIELGGANGADVIRLYQGSVYAQIYADPAPNSTAGVFMQGSGSQSGKVGVYPGEGFTSWVTGGTSRSAVSCTTNATNIWGGDVTIEAQGGAVAFTQRTGSGGSIQGSRTLQLLGAGSGEPAIYAPNYDTQIVLTGAGVAVQTRAGVSKQILASNVAASSRRIKKGEKAIKFPRGLTAGGVVDALVPKQWNYEDDWVEGEPRPRKTYTMRGDIRRDDEGRAIVDPDTLVPLREPDQEFEVDPGEPVKPKLGLIAEDVQAVVPEIVQSIPGVAGGLGLADRDLIAVLWLAVREGRVQMKNLRQAVQALGGTVAAG